MGNFTTVLWLFATGDTIAVSNNLVALNLYKQYQRTLKLVHVPLSRQLFEGSSAHEVASHRPTTPTTTSATKRAPMPSKIPSIIKHIASRTSTLLSGCTVQELGRDPHQRQRKEVPLLNLICFAACVEGLSSTRRLLYVYFLV